MPYKDHTEIRDGRQSAPSRTEAIARAMAKLEGFEGPAITPSSRWMYRARAAEAAAAEWDASHPSEFKEWLLNQPFIVNPEWDAQTPRYGEWQPIESAPKEGGYTEGNNRHGPWILAYPVHGEVARVRWWDGNGPGETRWCNFLGDCGNAYRPTYWMPLPEPPK